MTYLACKWPSLLQLSLIVCQHERSVRQVLFCFSRQPRDSCQIGFDLTVHRLAVVRHSLGPDFARRRQPTGECLATQPATLSHGCFPRLLPVRYVHVFRPAKRCEKNFPMCRERVSCAPSYALQPGLQIAVSCEAPSRCFAAPAAALQQNLEKA